MALKETLDQLERLQSLKEEIRLLQKDKQALYVDVEHQREIVEDVARRLEEANQQRLECQKQADSMEVKVKSAEEENEKLRIQLNTTKHQDDYDRIRNAIMSNTADISRWEDEELDLLDRIDELERKRAELEAQHENEKVKLQQIKDRVAEEAAEYERKIEGLKQEETQLRDEINQEVLTAYQRLISSRGTTVVVKLRNRVCQGCFTTLPKQIENELMREDEVIFCPNCGRILVLKED